MGVTHSSSVRRWLASVAAVCGWVCYAAPPTETLVVFLWALSCLDAFVAYVAVHCVPLKKRYVFMVVLGGFRCVAL